MDRQEFTALYERLRRPLYAYAAARLSAQVALDVVHDTFEVVWAKRDGAPSTADERAAWCFGIARNKVLQESQRTRRKHHDNRFLKDLGPSFLAASDLLTGRPVRRRIARQEHPVGQTTRSEPCPAGRSVRAAAASVLVGGLGLAGCTGAEVSPPPPSSQGSTPSGAGPSATDRPTSSPTATTRAREEPVLNSPLQAYRLTPSEFATVTYARSVVVGQCMQRFGFVYPGEDLPSFSDHVQETVRGERSGLSRVYGITSREDAERHGYQTAGFGAEDLPSSDSDAYEFVLTGTRSVDGVEQGGGNTKRGESPGEIDGQEVPAGGCVGEADAALADDPDISVYGLGHTLWIEGGAQLRASTEYQDAVADWVACMAADGHRVTDPLEDQGDIRAAQAARQESGSADAPAAEIRLALADIDCKERPDLVGRLDRAGAEIDRKTIADNQLALTEDRDRLDRQLELAARIVEESGR